MSLVNGGGDVIGDQCSRLRSILVVTTVVMVSVCVIGAEGQDMCSASWTQLNSTRSTNGVLYGLYSLPGCQSLCVMMTSPSLCIAIDVIPFFDMFQCWLHFNLQNLNTWYNIPYSTEYVLDNRCALQANQVTSTVLSTSTSTTESITTSSTMQSGTRLFGRLTPSTSTTTTTAATTQSTAATAGECTVTWSCQDNMHAYYGVVLVGSYSKETCMSYCAANTSCVGVDLDSIHDLCYTFSSSVLFNAAFTLSNVKHCAATNRVCPSPPITTPTTTSSSGSTTKMAARQLCTSGEFACVDGPCVDDSLRCNGNAECPNSDDEFNCECTDQQYACTSGLCISNSLVCDGVHDCADADDESPSRCDGLCRADQFQCTASHECLLASQRCDGMQDCLDSSDEQKCERFLVTSSEKKRRRRRRRHASDELLVYPSSALPLSVTYRGRSNYCVCADGWNQQWSDLACRDMGFVKSSSSVYVRRASSDSMLYLNTVSQPFSFIAGLTDRGFRSCTSNAKVSLNCLLPGCGWRTVGEKYDGTFVNSGSVSSTGAWPWHVAIFHDGVYACAGSLVAPNWVVTSARCTSLGGSSVKAMLTTVRAGSSNLSSATADDDSMAQVSSVDLVIGNPSFNVNSWRGDLALLRLTTSLQMTPTVQTICLPLSSSGYYRQSGSSSMVCAVAGWTPLQPSLSQSSARENALRQVRVNPLSGTSCVFGSSSSAANDPSILCLDQTTLTNNSTIGLGASTVCRDVTGTWSLVGVVLGTAENPNYSANPLTNVAFYADWISSIINPITNK